jgi:hypothetical protein
LSASTETSETPVLSFGQWSMRSLLMSTAIIAFALGLWRSEGNLGAAFALVAFPAMVMNWAERFFKLDPSELLGKSLDLFMGVGACAALVYCSWLIAGSVGSGYLGSALCQTVLAAAIGAAFGVAYCLLVIAFYGVAKCLTRW